MAKYFQVVKWGDDIYVESYFVHRSLREKITFTMTNKVQDAYRFREDNAEHMQILNRIMAEGNGIRRKSDEQSEVAVAIRHQWGGGFNRGTIVTAEEAAPVTNNVFCVEDFTEAEAEKEATFHEKLVADSEVVTGPDLTQLNAIEANLKGFDDDFIEGMRDTLDTHAETFKGLAKVEAKEKSEEAAIKEILAEVTDKYHAILERLSKEEAEKRLDKVYLVYKIAGHTQTLKRVYADEETAKAYCNGLNTLYEYVANNTMYTCEARTIEYKTGDSIGF